MLDSGLLERKTRGNREQVFNLEDCRQKASNKRKKKRLVFYLNKICIHAV